MTDFVNYRNVNVDAIEEDLRDEYREYRGMDKLACMMIDIHNLIYCVRALREELSNNMK